MDTERMTSETVHRLNDLLTGELSAVETYTQAMDKVAAEEPLRELLEHCRISHQKRALRLAEAVRSRGGQPIVAAGPWGIFARALEGGTGVMGRSVALATLAQGEDQGIKHYRDSLGRLDMAGRSLVVAELLPEQADTLDTVRRLNVEQINEER